MRCIPQFISSPVISSVFNLKDYDLPISSPIPELCKQCVGLTGKSFLFIYIYKRQPRERGACKLEQLLIQISWKLGIAGVV